MIFFSLVLIPAVREGLSPSNRPDLIRAIGKRYRKVGWISVAVLLVSGFILAWESNVDWGSEFGQVFILKLTLVGVMLVLTVLHDVMGTRSVIGQRSHQESRRKLMTWLARANLFVVLVIIFCGVVLTRY
jgi:uncharacterized membrane protein